MLTSQKTSRCLRLESTWGEIEMIPVLGLTLKEKSFISLDFLGLCLQNVSWNFQRCIPHRLGKILRLMVIRKLENIFVSQTFTMSHRQNSPPGSYHHPNPPPSERNYSLPTGTFFKKSVSAPSRKRRGDNVIRYINLVYSFVFTQPALFVQIQQWKQWSNVWKLFTVKDKDTRAASWTTFWSLWC